MAEHLTEEGAGDGASTAPVEIAFDPSFWTTAIGAEVRSALEDWAARGWIDAPDGVPRHLRVSSGAWDGASVARASAAGERDLEQLSAQADILCRLVGIPGGTAAISSTTFVGAPTLRFEAKISQASAPRRHALTAVVCPRLPEHPDLRWLRQRLAAQPAEGLASTETQLGVLADLRRADEALRVCGSQVAFEFDRHLRDFEIVEPERVGLAWTRERLGKNDSYSVEPWIETRDGSREPLPLTGVSAREPIVKLPGRKRFARLDRETDAIVRHVRAFGRDRSERAAVPLIAEVGRLIPEGVSTAKIDLSEYGNRVLGFETVACAGRAFDIESSGIRWFPEELPESPSFLTLKVRSVSPDSAPVVLDLKTVDDVKRLRDAVRRELSCAAPGMIDHDGVRVIPTEPLFHALDVALAEYEQTIQQREPTQKREQKSRLGVVLGPGAASPLADTDEQVPWKKLDAVLLPGVTLKQHQREGIAWLWQHHRRRRSGVLLADEMGLGKTLQIACFLALQRDAAVGRDAPALVIAPVMLIENWAEELGRFLRADAFEPLFILHGDGIRDLKQVDGSLDVAPLRRCSVVLTNYDTLDRHQKSLLTVDWRTVVLDEAQNIKNPETFRSKAARGLKREFAICSTGTPVENRLLDLWTLFDFLSPGEPLGSTEAEFKGRFESDGTPEPSRVAEALEYPSPGSPLLRRTKDRVLDLQPKTFQMHAAAMTDEQMALERQIVRGLAGTERNTLAVLSKLRSLYQHPWLLRSSLFGVDDDEAVPPLDTIVGASPKLRLCLEILDGVRDRGEKALVFSPWIKMQQLLAHVFRLNYGLNPRIVNGDANQRKQALKFIDDFSRVEGFNVLVLSPLAAGAGLNIVAANHVIHYGRWWNPAKEDQATDRVHRIGQERPVMVHYPILHHPGAPDGGFDVALHNLVERKRGLARDFLCPDADVTAQDIREVLHQPSEAVQ